MPPAVAALLTLVSFGVVLVFAVWVAFLCSAVAELSKGLAHVRKCVVPALRKRVDGHGELLALLGRDLADDTETARGQVTHALAVANAAIDEARRAHSRLNVTQADLLAQDGRLDETAKRLLEAAGHLKLAAGSVGAAGAWLGVGDADAARTSPTP